MSRRRTQPARIGVYGGTFNPVHVGHLRAAEEVAEALELERVLFVPSGDPPHKSDEALAPARTRLAWVERATAGNPRFAVDPLEVERGGRSYTVDTLAALGARDPGELVFCIGRDAFADLGTWRQPEVLFELAHFAVTTRPSSHGERPAAPAGPIAAKDTLRELLPDCVRDEIELAPDGLSGRHRRAGTWVRLLEITALDVSSSDIRRRLREGGSIRYLVPESIHDAIVASGCYGGGS